MSNAKRNGRTLTRARSKDSSPNIWHQGSSTRISQPWQIPKTAWVSLRRKETRSRRKTRRIWIRCKLASLWKITIIPSKRSPLLCLTKWHCWINSQRRQKAHALVNHKNSSNLAWATSSAFYVRRALSVKRNMRDMAKLQFTKLTERGTLRKP